MSLYRLTPRIADPRLRLRALLEEHLSRYDAKTQERMLKAAIARLEYLAIGQELPNREDASTPRWLPLLFLVLALALGGILIGLIAWSTRVYVEVTPEPVQIHEPQSLKRGWTPEP